MGETMMKSKLDHRQRFNRIMTSFEQNGVRIAEIHHVEASFSGWAYKKNKQKSDALIGNTAYLDFGSYELVFKYHRFNLIRQGSSIVSAGIALKLKEGRKLIPTDVLMNVLNPSDFTPFVYQELYDEAMMTLAFDELNDWFTRYQNDIEQLVQDPSAVTTLNEAVIEDMAIYFSKQLEQKQEIYDYYLNYKIFRFSFSNYQLFLLGEYRKCLSSYRRFNKQGRFPAYDRRMIDLMEVRSSIEGYRPKALVAPLIESNYRYYRILGFLPFQKQNAVSYFTATALMLIPAWAFTYALMGILGKIVTAGALYTSSPVWDLGLWIGCFGAFGLGVVTYSWMHGRLFKKDHERFLSLSALTMSELDRKILKFFAALLVMVNLTMSTLAALDRITLRDKTFTLDNFFIDLTLMKTYEYDQIDHVEYRPTLIEGGEESPYENYAIVMKDGKEFHLYSTVSLETIESKILPIFIDKGVSVIKRQP